MCDKVLHSHNELMSYLSSAMKTSQGIGFSLGGVPERSSGPGSRKNRL